MTSRSATELTRVKQETDLRNLIPSDMIARRTDRYIKVHCPFHGDQRASCLVYPDGFVCYGCDARGDAIAWVQQATGRSFQQTVQFLAEQPSSPIAIQSPQKTSKIDAARIWAWHYSLTPDLAAYYVRRGLTPQSIRRYVLGWGSRFDHEPARYTLPYFKGSGVEGVKFRTAGEEEPKYTSLPNTHPQVWTPDGCVCESLPEHQEVLITEGEFDAMIGNQMGMYAISPADGAQHLPTCLTALREVPRVYAVLDNDPINHKTGKRPGETFGRRLLSLIPRARIIRLPESYKDLTEYWLAGYRNLDDLKLAAEKGAFRRLVCGIIQSR